MSHKHLKPRKQRRHVNYRKCIKRGLRWGYDCNAPLQLIARWGMR